MKIFSSSTIFYIIFAGIHKWLNLSFQIRTQNIVIHGIRRISWISINASDDSFFTYFLYCWLSLSPLPPLCAAINLLHWALSWTGMCWGVWAKAVPTRCSTSRLLSEVTWPEEDLKESSGSLFDFLHLFDLTDQLTWITAKLNLSRLNILTMTILTGTQTTQSQPRHPKSEYKNCVKS